MHDINLFSAANIIAGKWKNLFVLFCYPGAYTQQNNCKHTIYDTLFFTVKKQRNIAPEIRGFCAQLL